MTIDFFTKNTLAAMSASLLLGFTSTTFAQSPGEPGVMNNPTGHPSYTELNKKGQDATVIFGNSDGAKQNNEYIYFKVYPYGAGNNLDGYDWYYNPTAWISAFDFHFFNTNLRMYGNVIKFNNAPKSRRIIFDQETWSTDDNQFTGLGSTDNNDLRYQIKDATKSHKFFAGFDTKNSKPLLTISGSGEVGLPKGGQLSLGYGQNDVGAIAYQKLGDGLDISGAGPAKATRFFSGLDKSSSKLLLTVNGNGEVGIPKGGQLFFGYDANRQADAGSIAYQKYSDGLDIFGAGPQNATRIVKVWAEKGTSFNGFVSIGSDDTWKHIVPPTKLDGDVDLTSYKLFVKGGILATECRVAEGWADYVFAPDYKLRSLPEVEKQIQQLGHLPGMPSSKEVETSGLNLGHMSKLQQEKIEELTLYLIELRKEVDVLRAELKLGSKSPK